MSNVGEWVLFLGWLDVQCCARKMKQLLELHEKIVDEHEEPWIKTTL